jgi:hypothetical protein
LQAFTLDFLCGSEDVEEVVGLFSEVLRWIAGREGRQAGRQAGWRSA